jgi:hypothetical protein
LQSAGSHAHEEHDRRRLRPDLIMPGCDIRFL